MVTIATAVFTWTVWTEVGERLSGGFVQIVNILSFTFIPCTMYGRDSVLLSRQLSLMTRNNRNTSLIFLKHPEYQNVNKVGIMLYGVFLFETR